MTTHADRMAAIKARLDALPDFIGLPKSQRIGGRIMPPDGNATYVDTNTEAFHEYTAHAYGDLTYMAARIARYESALEAIIKMAQGDDIECEAIAQCAEDALAE